MPHPAKSSVIPTLRYHDGHRAIEFLCKAFGFEAAAVYEGPDNTVAHAQLVLGGGMIMLGSGQHGGEYGNWVQPPAQPGVVLTSGVYVIVDDCDAHYARAKAAGAQILMEPRDEDYGGRHYACRDPEGYVWSFGTYDPWSGETK
jgi:uncharacterized glyoxalase superfamily protein PhnB